MPPIAAAFTPTLASGDASELLPPLLAPQGWAGCIQAASAGNHGIYEIQSLGIGGCFVDFDANQPVGIHLSDTSLFTLVNRAIQEQVPGVKSKFGCSVKAAGFFPIASNDFITSPGFGAWPPSRPLYIPPGKFLYIYAIAPSLQFQGGAFIRDVPAGIAAD